MNIRKYFSVSKMLVFTRWQHRNYSAFNTLHRQVKIGTLAIAYFICLGCLNTFAQTDTTSITKKIHLAEVQVSARRASSLYSEVGRMITVVPRSEIETLPVQSIQGLLKYVMNVDVRERGPLGVQADLSIRGGSFDQVMILLNGINITDPQTGHHNLNLPVDFNSIDRIEIIEGPAARVHGPNAFSGAINIITGTSNKNKVSVHTMGGEHGLYNAGATLNQNIGKTTSYLSAGKGAGDGYIDNTDFDISNLFYQLRYHNNDERLNFQAGYTTKAFGANSFYTSKYPDQYEETRTFFSSLGFETGSSIRLNPSIYWRRQHDKFKLVRSSEDSDGTNFHLTDVFGGSVNATIAWKYGKTSLGGEVRSENIWSNNIGDEMDEPLDVPGEPGAKFTKSYGRSNASLFLEHNFKLGNLSVSGGVMANFNSGLDYKLKWFQGIDVSYWVLPGLKWMASYNKSLRMPSFTDLSYNSPVHVGNSDLVPEEAATVETGFKYTGSLIRGHVNGFFRKGKNLIDWGRPVGEEVYTTINVNDVDAYGIEFGITVSPERLGVPLVKKMELGYAWLDQDKNPESGFESQYVLNHLVHKLNIGVQHKVAGPVSAHWNFLFQDRVGSFTRSSDNTQIDYKPFWLTDLRIIWSKKGWHIFAEAANLFDKHYFDMGELARPGRWVRAGIQFSLKY
jgi:vitamin B12 transporter